MGLAIPLIGLAAGAGLQMAAAQRVRNAQDSAYSQAIKKQAGFREQAGKKFQQYLPTTGLPQAQQDMQSAEGKRQQGYDRMAAKSLATGLPALDLATQTRNSAQIGQQAGARARLGSYQDWQVQQGIRDLRAQQDQQMIGNFAEGTSRLLPLQLQAASHAGDSLAGIGSLVSLAGGLYGAGSGSGLFGATGNAAADTAGQVDEMDKVLGYAPAWGGR